MFKKIITIIIGTIGIGVGITFCIVANLGIDPCSTFNNGLSNWFNIEIGTMMIITNAIIFGFMLIFYREGVHLGTIINAFGVGITINLILPTLLQFQPTTLIGQLILTLVGILIVCIFIGVYIAPNLGFAPWDAIGYMLQKKLPFSYARIRIGYEILAVIIGIILHAQFGIATIILAFGLGPAIDFFGQKFKTILNFN